MKLTKLIEPKQLLPLFSLVAPVAGEMVISKEGLSSPWPIALISSLVAFYSLCIDPDSEITRLGFLIVIGTTFRNWIGLIGSMNSLRVHGLTGFQYPELSWLAFFSVLNLIGKWKEIHRASLDVPLLERWWIEWNKIFSYLALYSVFGINLWNIVSLGIYASLKNFSKSAQFLTNCSQIPKISWYTIAQCTPIESGGFSCFLGSKNIWIIDLFIRSIGMFIFLFFSATCLEKEGSLDNSRSGWGRKIKKTYYKKTYYYTNNKVIILVTAFYLISMAIIQAKGLNTTGLEGICDINQELISSKTGYIVEWFQQNLVALKQITLI